MSMTINSYYSCTFSSRHKDRSRLFVAEDAEDNNACNDNHAEHHANDDSGHFPVDGGGGRGRAIRSIGHASGHINRARNGPLNQCWVCRNCGDLKSRSRWRIGGGGGGRTIERAENLL